jgi:hypothetical protein
MEKPKRAREISQPHTPRSAQRTMARHGHVRQPAWPWRMGHGPANANGPSPNAQNSPTAKPKRQSTGSCSRARTAAHRRQSTDADATRQTPIVKGFSRITLTAIYTALGLYCLPLCASMHYGDGVARVLVQPCGGRCRSVCTTVDCTVCWGGLPPGVAFSLWEGVCRHATPCDLGARHDGVMKDTDPTRSYDIFTYCAPRSCSVSSSWNSKKGWPWLPPRATREKLCVLFMPSCPPL